MLLEEDLLALDPSGPQSRPTYFLPAHAFISVSHFTKGCRLLRVYYVPIL